jgi:tetratricopeptide (TPR) repeat protein
MKRLLVIAALLGATGLAASRLDRGSDRPYDISFVPPSTAARWMSLGHPTLLANLWWLRAVQYIGDPHANARGWERLYPTVDLVTDLDPGHGYAYQVAGTLLGSLNRVEQSDAILEKGMRNTPNRYILPFLRAYNAFYYRGDYAEAGRFVELAAKVPGAPQHLRQNVLAMYAKGRRADAAIAFLQQSLAAAADPETRKAVEEQLKRAYLERAATQLDDALAVYLRHFAWPPISPWQLVHVGLLPEVPADPYGGEFVIGKDGRYRSTLGPDRFAPPDRPGQMRKEPGVRDEDKR